MFFASGKLLTFDFREVHSILIIVAWHSSCQFPSFARLREPFGLLRTHVCATGPLGSTKPAANASLWYEEVCSTADLDGRRSIHTFLSRNCLGTIFCHPPRANNLPAMTTTMASAVGVAVSCKKACCVAFWFRASVDFNIDVITTVVLFRCRSCTAVNPKHQCRRQAVKFARCCRANSHVTFCVFFEQCEDSLPFQRACQTNLAVGWTKQRLKFKVHECCACFCVPVTSRCNGKTKSISTCLDIAL